jgi:hypothetical protein
VDGGLFYGSADYYMRARWGICSFTVFLVFAQECLLAYCNNKRYALVLKGLKGSATLRIIVKSFAIGQSSTPVKN